MSWFRRKPKTQPKLERKPFRTDLPPIDATPEYRAVFRAVREASKRSLGGVEDPILVSECEPVHPFVALRAWLHEGGDFRELTGEEYDQVILSRGDGTPFPAAGFWLESDGAVHFSLHWRPLAAHGGKYLVARDEVGERLEKVPGTQWAS